MIFYRDDKTISKDSQVFYYLDKSNIVGEKSYTFSNEDSLNEWTEMMQTYCNARGYNFDCEVGYLKDLKKDYEIQDYY